MKAIQFSCFGGPEVLYLSDLPQPMPEPGEVVVAIHAASVNPADWKGCAGVNENARNITFPHCPGRDFSGIVTAVGAGVAEFAPGDAVFGVVAATTESTYAEAVAIPATMIARKPDTVSHVEMAAIALGALTATIALEDTGHVAAGETVLVQGGAGGVGSMAVQLAHHLGAHVIATASAANHDYLKSLGASDVIDYTREDFTRLGRCCDVVFDTVGESVQSRSFAVLKPNGRLVFVARGEVGFTPPAGFQILRPNVVRDRVHLDHVADLVARAILKPPAIATMPLEQAGVALELSKTHHVRGKIVLTVRS